MLAGAQTVLRQAGCALVGGHSSEGSEMALGELCRSSWPWYALWWWSLASPADCCSDFYAQHHLPSPLAGFSVYGSAPRGQLLSKAGLQPGQALILTKPIGTGQCSPCELCHQALCGPPAT